MADLPPDKEFDLKKRLVGAFILIGFGVVVLPAVLGGKNPEAEFEQEMTTQAQDTRIFVSKITPIGGATPRSLRQSEDQLVAAKPPDPDPVTPAQTGKQTEKKKAAEAQVSKAQTSQPEPKQDSGSLPIAATSPLDEPGWVIRVGTFSKKDNAKRVVKRLEQAGFKPSTSGVKTDKGTMTRVWIGPYAQRVDAARMRTRVQQVTGGEGFIAAYP